MRSCVLNFLLKIIALSLWLIKVILQSTLMANKSDSSIYFIVVSVSLHEIGIGLTFYCSSACVTKQCR